MHLRIPIPFCSNKEGRRREREWKWVGRQGTVTRRIPFKGAEEVGRLLKDRKWKARTSKGFSKDCGVCCQMASVVSFLCACPWHPRCPIWKTKESLQAEGFILGETECMSSPDGLTPWICALRHSHFSGGLGRGSILSWMPGSSGTSQAHRHTCTQCTDKHTCTHMHRYTNMCTHIYAHHTQSQVYAFKTWAYMFEVLIAIMLNVMLLVKKIK